MMMPKMDGLSMVRRMREEGLTPDTRIIMLTSLTKAGDPAVARELGIGQYLTKPVRQSQLYDSLITTLNITGTSGNKEAPAAEGKNDTPSPRPERILIAEDNRINQKVVQGLLKKFGFNTEIANNGREALELTQQHHYDLLFMDCQMPEMDGYEATHQIRQHLKSDTLPIVAMTANAMDGDMEKCLACGMNDYISKPLKIAEMKAMLDKWLPPV
jgi:CheY-like chemotaxis protein